MSRVWRKTGNIAFWLSYPLLQVYLRIGWRTRVVVVVGTDILLVKGWLGSNQWQLPGGGAHRGEPHVEAACRELKEETGITVTPKALKLLYQDRSSHKGLSFRYRCYGLRLDTRPIVKKKAFEIVETAWLPLQMVTKENATQETCQATRAWLKQSDLL
ncbi:MAG: NUDIX hydrolase [Candidatus Saccharimonadales bacterium]